MLILIALYFIKSTSQQNTTMKVSDAAQPVFTCLALYPYIKFITKFLLHLPMHLPHPLPLPFRPAVKSIVIFIGCHEKA